MDGKSRKENNINRNLQQKILSNDLYNDVSDNKGIDEWLDGYQGKINNCWKRMQTEWTTKLMNDSNFRPHTKQSSRLCCTCNCKK